MWATVNFLEDPKEIKSIIKDKNYALAIDKLNKLLRMDNQDSEGYFLRSICYQKLGDDPLALKDAILAENYAKFEDSSLLMHLAKCQMRCARYNDSNRTLMKAQLLDAKALNSSSIRNLKKNNEALKLIAVKRELNNKMNKGDSMSNSTSSVSSSKSDVSVRKNKFLSTLIAPSIVNRVLPPLDGLTELMSESSVMHSPSIASTSKGAKYGGLLSVTDMEEEPSSSRVPFIENNLDEKFYSNTNASSIYDYATTNDDNEQSIFESMMVLESVNYLRRIASEKGASKTWYPATISPRKSNYFERVASVKSVDSSHASVVCRRSSIEMLSRPVNKLNLITRKLSNAVPLNNSRNRSPSPDTSRSKSPSLRARSPYHSSNNLLEQQPEPIETPQFVSKPFMHFPSYIKYHTSMRELKRKKLGRCTFGTQLMKSLSAEELRNILMKGKPPSFDEIPHSKQVAKDRAELTSMIAVLGSDCSNAAEIAQNEQSSHGGLLAMDSEASDEENLRIDYLLHESNYLLSQNEDLDDGDVIIDDDVAEMHESVENLRLHLNSLKNGNVGIVSGLRFRHPEYMS